MITSNVLGLHPKKQHTSGWSAAQKFRISRGDKVLDCIYQIKSGVPFILLPGYRNGGYKREELIECGWSVIPPLARKTV